jgi:hypothetical protein
MYHLIDAGWHACERREIIRQPNRGIIVIGFLLCGGKLWSGEFPKAFVLAVQNQHRDPDTVQQLA